MKISKETMKDFREASDDLKFAMINMRFEIIAREHCIKLDRLKQSINNKIKSYEN